MMQRKKTFLLEISKEKIENVEFGRIAAQIAKQVIVQKVRMRKVETIKNSDLT